MGWYKGWVRGAIVGVGLVIGIGYAANFCYRTPKIASRDDAIKALVLQQDRCMGERGRLLQVYDSEISYVERKHFASISDVAAFKKWRVDPARDAFWSKDKECRDIFDGNKPILEELAKDEDELWMCLANPLCKLFD